MVRIQLLSAPSPTPTLSHHAFLSTHLGSERLDAGDHHLGVAALVQVGRLEDAHAVHAVRLAEVHERLDVLQLQAEDRHGSVVFFQLRGATDFEKEE